MKFNYFENIILQIKIYFIFILFVEFDKILQEYLFNMNDYSYILR